MLSNLPEHYHPIDVFIDLDGAWHYNGKKEKPHKILGKVDVVWNALHGEFGEDGAVQGLLELHGIRFSGTKRLGAVFSFNKFLAKQLMEKEGIKTPHALIFRREDVPSPEVLAGELYRTFPQPCVVKPVSKGSSIGISVAQTPDEITVALTTAFSISEKILVEEFIAGREAVCGVVEQFRGSPYYSLLPVEVVLPENHRFFNFETRYSEGGNHRCPGNFSTEEKEEHQRLSKEVHRQLGLRH